MTRKSKFSVSILNSSFSNIFWVWTEKKIFSGLKWENQSEPNFGCKLQFSAEEPPVHVEIWTVIGKRMCERLCVRVSIFYVFLCLSVCSLSVCVSMCAPVCLCASVLCVCVRLCLSVYVFVCSISVCVSMCVPVCLCIYLCVRMFCLSLWGRKR